MKFYFIAGIVTILLGIYISIDFFKELDSKYYGETIEAECTTIPDVCLSRNNWIEVKYQNNSYSIRIGDSQCIEQDYKVNKLYKFKYSVRFDYMTTLHRKPEILFPFLIFIFGITIYCFWKMQKS